MFVAFLLCWYIKVKFMNNQPHICIRKRALHIMPMVAHRRSTGNALLILNISTTLGWVNSSMPRMLCSQESGPFPSVNKAGWAPGLVQTGIRKRKSLTPHRRSNTTVRPVANCYTISAILPASHTEGAGMSMAHSREKSWKLRFIKIYMALTPNLCSSILWFMYLSPLKN